MRLFDYLVENANVLIRACIIGAVLASSAHAAPSAPGGQQSLIPQASLIRSPSRANSLVRLPAEKPVSYVYPVMSPRLTSSFGRRIHPIKRFSRQHRGIDLAAPVGSPIRAIASGTVVFADPYGGYGKLIVIKHGGKLTSHYAHCSSVKVRTGERVRAGQIIGTVGSSGHSTGPHLHLELRIDGQAQDPEKFIPGLADEAKG